MQVGDGAFFWGKFSVAFVMFSRISMTHKLLSIFGPGKLYSFPALLPWIRNAPV
jgi:hypothetical protein